MNKEGKIILTIVTLFYVLSAMVGISRIKIVYDIAGNGIGLSLLFLLVLALTLIFYIIWIKEHLNKKV